MGRLRSGLSSRVDRLSNASSSRQGLARCRSASRRSSSPSKLSVADNGNGSDKSALENVFVSFPGRLTSQDNGRARIGPGAVECQAHRTSSWGPVTAPTRMRLGKGRHSQSSSLPGLPGPSWRQPPSAVRRRRPWRDSPAFTSRQIFALVVDDDPSPRSVALVNDPSAPRSRMRGNVEEPITLTR